TVTGATGHIGSALVARLRERGDEVTVLSRSPARATERLGVPAAAWDLMAGPAPAEALAGRDAVVHLAGEDIGQRWSQQVKREIRASREQGTRHLVDGLRAAQPRPGLLVSASGSGYYGARGDEPVDEGEPPGDDFVARICVAWEREAQRAEELGLRVIRVRTGPVLDRASGALAKMLPPFRLGVGGPVAGGEQYLPWIHLDDVVGLYLAALDSQGFWGAVNASAPEPATNKAFSKALGRALHRPALAPVPTLALRILYGEMAQIVTEGVRMVPGRAGGLGYAFAHPDLDEALRSALT
ncbi:MAG TPA: TIGR01777 family oxidoreductase, partial [Solirubrobacteraceae bacterium]|nr:TIGR01777 family oxidoreductase [Solirubrobacteraceae bacterium]